MLGGKTVFLDRSLQLSGTIFDYIMFKYVILRLFSALSYSVGPLQISVIIIIDSPETST